MHNDCILFFVKYPEKGKVKTRLAINIGYEMATELYKNFVVDILFNLEKRDFPYMICFSPLELQMDFKEWLGSKHRYLPQIGSDLGERMCNSFISAFSSGIHKAIIIGSDCPHLPIDIIKQAFESLDKYDVVIGPAFDGGYYLIGFKNKTFSKEIFQGINWSTKTVFSETTEIITRLGLKFHVLPVFRDIDDLDDLIDLAKNYRHNFRDSRTINYIKTCLLIENIRKE